jgi:hypothetical protein
MPPHPALTDILVKFHEAAEALGLIDGDNSWDDSLKEATIWAMPPINTKVICNNIRVW